MTREQWCVAGLDQYQGNKCSPGFSSFRAARNGNERSGNRGDNKICCLAFHQLAQGSHRHGAAVLVIEVLLGFASYLTMSMFVVLRNVLMLRPQLCHWLK